MDYVLRNNLRTNAGISVLSSASLTVFCFILFSKQKQTENNAQDRASVYGFVPVLERRKSLCIV